MVTPKWWFQDGDSKVVNLSCSSFHRHSYQLDMYLAALLRSLLWLLALCKAGLGEEGTYLRNNRALQKKYIYIHFLNACNPLGLLLPPLFGFWTKYSCFLHIGLSMHDGYILLIYQQLLSTRFGLKRCHIKVKRKLKFSLNKTNENKIYTYVTLQSCSHLFLLTQCYKLLKKIIQHAPQKACGIRSRSLWALIIEMALDLLGLLLPFFFCTVHFSCMMYTL